MTDTVDVNLGDNKSEVALKMARDIYYGSDKTINLDSKDEFLDLVQECVRALNGSTKRSIG